jgi:hypothetical protein
VSRYWFTLPGFALLGIVVLLQLRRRKAGMALAPA